MPRPPSGGAVRIRTTHSRPWKAQPIGDGRCPENSQRETSCGFDSHAFRPSRPTNPLAWPLVVDSKRAKSAQNRLKPGRQGFHVVP